MDKSNCDKLNLLFQKLKKRKEEFEQALDDLSKENSSQAINLGKEFEKIKAEIEDKLGTGKIKAIDQNGKEVIFNMPEICRFLGIIIAMYYRDHEPAHFHAIYGSYRAAIAIHDLTMLEGDLSPKAVGAGNGMGKTTQTRIAE